MRPGVMPEATAGHAVLQGQRVAASDFLAFEHAFQATARHRSQNRIAPLIGQWEVLITIFKHGCELPFLLGQSDADSSQHRTLLTGLLAMGENIWVQIKDAPSEILAQTGYEKSFVESNIEYLRGKYIDWYAPKDNERINQDWETLKGTDELAAAPK